MSREQQAFLFIADITGYTGYLNDSELEHAKGTLTDLLQILVDRAGAPLRVSKLEGDAVFSYAFEDGFTDGKTFLDLVEDTYVAFRRAIDSMVLNNTCQCNACANVSSLDLKFVVHFGSFLIQRIGTYDELLGPDVTLVHRLLKNSVTDQLGVRAYCLYTKSAWNRLGLQDVTTLVAHDEDVPDFGLVETYIQNLGDVYRPGEEAGITLDDSEIKIAQKADIPMKPAVLWDYLSSPLFRSILTGSQKQEIQDLVGGRIGVGSTYQCYHGNRVTPQRIIEWEPFTKIVTEDLIPQLKGSVLVFTYLEETPSGTHLRLEFGGFKGPRWSEPLFRVGGIFMKRVVERNVADFVEAVSTDHLRRSEARTAEPIMP